MKRIEYIAEYQERENDRKQTAKLSLGNYANWEEVFNSGILWGSIYFIGGDTITLKKDKKFPTKTKKVTYFDREESWTYVRILSITKREIITTSTTMWQGNSKSKVV